METTIERQVWKGSRVVRISNSNTAGIFQSRLYVNNGETATLTARKAKTLKGALKQAEDMLR